MYLFFYSLGQADNVKCFHCGLLFKDWQQGDDPVDAHRQSKPTCPVVLALDENLSGQVPGSGTFLLRICHAQRKTSINKILNQQ